ncbi:response regulator transcription factor [Delftia tsuruhatensis]
MRIAPRASANCWPRCCPMCSRRWNSTASRIWGSFGRAWPVIGWARHWQTRAASSTTWTSSSSTPCAPNGRAGKVLACLRPCRLRHRAAPIVWWPTPWSSRCSRSTVCCGCERAPVRSRRAVPREATVARLVVRGLTHKQIAVQLQRAPATVRNQIRSIYEKLGIANVASLAEALRLMD